ncbi:MAG: glutathione S-transferase [Pseudomonadales bacterium]|nr:glutathione S-transferase [Pseudomonadales bacterium]
MKLYDFPQAPNPRRVNIFIAEKGIEIERVIVDFAAGEHRQDAYRAMNPACDVPMLETDKGIYISQIRGITRYLEEIYPDTPLLGRDATEKGLVEMWEHLAFMNGILAVAGVLRNTSKGFVDRALVGPHGYPQSTELATRGATQIQNFFTDFDQQLANNQYVAGDAYSMADITTLVTCDFAKWVKAEIPKECTHLRAWHAKVSERAAVKANP